MTPNTSSLIALAAILLAATPGWGQNSADEQTQPAAAAQPSPQTSAPSGENQPAMTAPIPAIAGSVALAPDSQSGVSGNVSADNDSQMLPPPPVSGEDYPIAFASETRSNTLRGGVAFNAAYSDNAFAGSAAPPVSDVSYSIFPTLALDETTGRTQLSLSYAPGFTFYQKLSSFDEADENLGVDYRYRLSPHVTLRLRDSFQKSSNAFNSPAEGLAGNVSGGVTGSGNFIVSPIADRLTNVGDAGISYQFSANGMIGGDAMFLNLHYPNPGQVESELYDTSAQVGSVFYTLQVNKQNYIGVTYSYQRLLAYPTIGTTETRSNGIVMFYTWQATRRFSISVFAGPQFSTTGTPGGVSSQMTSPEAGASLSWQGQHTVFAASYSHAVMGGGGLIGAVEADNASALARQQLSRNWAASLRGIYANNQILVAGDLPNTSGESTSVSAGLERAVGKSFIARAGYTRLRQQYAGVPVISAHPDTNREWLSVAYQFTRPLGR